MLGRGRLDRSVLLLADWVECRPVAETEPGLRGDTAQGGTKPAKMETGLVVNVPLFVNTGDKLKVDTRSGAYLERAN